MADGVPAPLLGVLHEALEEQLGGFLAGGLFGIAVGLRGEVRSDGDFDREFACVWRAFLLKDGVTGRRQIEGARDFLESALEIGKGGVLVLFQFLRGAQDVPYHELPRFADSGIELDGRDQGLDGVRQQSLLDPAAAQLLAAAEQQILAQSDLPGDFVQVRGAHQIVLEDGETALAVGGIAADERFADQKSEDRIAEEFELLVVLDRGLAPLVGMRGMRERADEEIAGTEWVTDRGLERLQIRAHGFDADQGFAAAGGAAWAAAFNLRALAFSASAARLIAGWGLGVGSALSRAASASSYFPALSRALARRTW